MAPMGRTTNPVNNCKPMHSSLRKIIEGGIIHSWLSVVRYCKHHSRVISYKRDQNEADEP